MDSTLRLAPKCKDLCRHRRISSSLNKYLCLLSSQFNSSNLVRLSSSLSRLSNNKRRHKSNNNKRRHKSNNNNKRQRIQAIQGYSRRRSNAISRCRRSSSISSSLRPAVAAVAVAW
jgi:hypothetical protein